MTVLEVLGAVSAVLGIWSIVYYNMYRPWAVQRAVRRRLQQFRENRSQGGVVLNLSQHPFDPDQSEQHWADGYEVVTFKFEARDLPRLPEEVVRFVAGLPGPRAGAWSGACLSSWPFPG